MSIKALSGLGLIAGAAMLSAASVAPAQAQGVPGGSYARTCTDIHMRGDHLIANCRRVDGSWARTGVNVDRCRGGVSNMNGNLTCGGGGGWARDDDRRFEGYGSSYDRGYRGNWGR